MNGVNRFFSIKLCFVVLFVLIVSGMSVSLFYKGMFYIHKLDNFAIVPPPELGSVIYQKDSQEYIRGYAMRGSPRWKEAIFDASYRNFDKRVSKALGIQITERTTPAIYQMLRIIQKSSNTVVGKIKRDYNRTRPYIVYKHLDCVSNGKDGSKQSSSYPSGHATFAWASGLALSAINPKHRQEIMHHAFDYGQSRVICGSHWQSDVDEGRNVGEAIYSELEKHPEFTDIMRQAKDEFESAKRN